MASKGTCKADKCEKDVRAKGYCDRHYRKWRKGLMGKPRHRTCNEKGCHKARDRKGLYAKARAGIVKEFTGVSDPYEEPVDASLAIPTTDSTPEQAADQVLDLLVREGYLAD